MEAQATNIEPKSDPPSKADLDLINFALTEGCGVDLRTVMTSDEFIREMDLQRALQDLRKGAIEKFMDEVPDVALSNVHAVSAYDTQKLAGEKDFTVEDADTLATLDAPNPVVSAIIKRVGKEYIEAAKRNMHWRAAELAGSYQRCTTPMQRAQVLSEVYKILDTTDWYKVTADSDEELDPGDDRIVREKDEHDPYGEIKHRPHSIFPTQHEDYPYSPYRISCLGNSIYLAAWAEMAGAEYMYTSQLRNNSAAMYGYALQGIWNVFDKLKEDQVTYSASTEELAAANEKDFLRHRDQIRTFHHAIAINCREPGKGGGWIHLDPYQNNLAWLNWYNAKQIKQLIDDRTSLYPGYAIAADVQAKYEQDFKDLDQSFECMMEVYELLKEKFKGGPPDTMKQLYHDIASLCYGLIPSIIEKWDLSIVDYRHLARPNFWLNYSFYEKAPNERDALVRYPKSFKRYDSDKAYRERRMDDILSRPLFEHLNTVSRLMDAELHRAQLADPAIEFSEPHFSIGLFVINHLRSTTDYGTVNLSRELVEHSGSQLIWYEAQQGSAEPPTAALERMTQFLGMYSTDKLDERVQIRLAISQRKED